MPSTNSQITGVVPARPALRIRAPVAVDRRSAELQLVKRIGLGVFAVQLAVLLVWSAVEASRLVQSAGFVGFYQAWYLIAHGVMDAGNWWQSQAVFIQWPLAPLALIWPHPFTLLAVQDLAIVGAQLVAYRWICDLVAERKDVPVRGYCLTGLALLALDPWIYWAASWDYHSEALGTLFAVLAARELFRGRRVAILWCFLTLLSGMVPATYLAGIGVCLLIKHRRRLVGCVLAGVSAAWFEALVRLGAGTGIAYATPGATIRYHAGVPIGSFSTRITALFESGVHYWIELLLNLVPAGFVGAFTTPVFGITAVVLGENLSEGNASFVIPSFQALPVYVFVPIGTVIALMWLRRTAGHRLANLLAVGLTFNVAIWGVTLAPKVIPMWLTVTPAEATAIKHVQTMIPQRDDVVVSEGISGAFATHPGIEPFMGTPMLARMDAPSTWFVIAPHVGNESAAAAQSQQLITAVEHDPAAKLEYLKAGIWVFRVRIHAGQAHQSLFVRQIATGRSKTTGRSGAKPMGS